MTKSQEKKPAFTFIDLFAGIGGFHFGMTSKGGECVYANEWDQYAGRTYKEWTGFHELDTRDLRKVPLAAIPPHDVLCAGFPCQPFSLAGVSKKNSLGRKHGFDDAEQGNLFFAICEVAQALKPKVLFLENVKNLKSHDKGRTWEVIKKKIEQDLGYFLFESVIDSSPWVPQRRERIFIVAFSKEYFSEAQAERFRFPESPSTRPTMAAILDPEPDQSLMISDNLWTYLQAYAAKHRAKGNGFGFGLVGPEDISRTMSARYYKDGSEILVRQSSWANPRRLSFCEAAKLMGFDETFSQPAGHGKAFPQVNSLSQSYRQFGNAVCPHVVSAIASEIVSVLESARSQKQKKGKSSRKKAVSR